VKIALGAEAPRSTFLRSRLKPRPTTQIADLTFPSGKIGFNAPGQADSLGTCSKTTVPHKPFTAESELKGFATGSRPTRS
jgi:hypothetical protein